MATVQERIAGLPQGEQLWPFLEEKPPVIVNSVEEFVQEALFADHVDRVVVLPNGINLLHQNHAIPDDITNALQGAKSVKGMLDALPVESREKYKARVWQFNIHGAEKEVKKADKAKSLRESVAILEEDMNQGVVERKAPLYLSELRHTEKVPHPIVEGEMVKTATKCDVKDALPQGDLLPFWERSEGGIFIGERGAGSGLHVDQCLWSNIGKQWSGHKLFAVWPWSERISIFDDVPRGSIFHFPLSEKEISCLKRACVVALLCPGDVFVFSGGIPHMAMCVGDDINVAAYESLVPLRHTAVRTLVRTNTKDHFKRCWMDDDDLDELYEDVVDAISGNLEDSSVQGRVRRELEACREAMKEHGDGYCRRLWKREDRKRQRREHLLHFDQYIFSPVAIDFPPAKRPRGHVSGKVSPFDRRYLCEQDEA